MADPMAVVRVIAGIDADPTDPSNKTVFMLKVQILNLGPPGEIDLPVSVLNAATKNQIKTAINDAIIADFATRGAVLTTQRIFTLADMAG